MKLPDPFDFRVDILIPTATDTFKTHLLNALRSIEVLYARELEESCDGAWDGQLCVDEARDSQLLRLGLSCAGRLAISYFMPTSRAHRAASSNESSFLLPYVQ